MRIGRSLAIALVALLALATPVMAYVLHGWYSTSVIDTNSNGEADLSVCYSTSTNHALYINRGQVDQEIERWHEASVGSFSSNGLCNNDGSSIEMLMRNDMGSCSPQTGGLLGLVNTVANTGYAQRQLWFNSNCLPHFDWYDTDGIDDGKISALAVALHEVGHTLGLGHSADDGAVMNAGGPDHCVPVGNDWTLAEDDAEGYRDRYPGIDDTAVVFPDEAFCAP